MYKLLTLNLHVFKQKFSSEKLLIRKNIIKIFIFFLYIFFLIWFTFFKFLKCFPTRSDLGYELKSAYIERSANLRSMLIPRIDLEIRSPLPKPESLPERPRQRTRPRGDKNIRIVNLDERWTISRRKKC